MFFRKYHATVASEIISFDCVLKYLRNLLFNSVAEKFNAIICNKPMAIQLHMTYISIAFSVDKILSFTFGSSILSIGSISSFLLNLFNFGIDLLQIGRYLARPAIAEYKILSYDGENVTFWYKSHETNERVQEIVTAYEFIGRLLMHIPPKYFKMVRSYGVYAGGISVKVKKCFELLQYIKSSQLIELWQIWHRKYGYIYDMGTY